MKNLKTVFIVILILLIGSSMQNIKAQRALVNSISNDRNVKKLKNETRVLVSNEFIEEIDANNVNSDQTFSITEDIYTRVIFPIQLRKIDKKQINFDVIDENTGERYELAWFDLNTGNENGTYIDLNLKDDLYLDYFQKFSMQLADGENLLRLVVSMGIGHTATKICETEITLTKSEGEKVLIGKTFDDYTAGMSNPELETQILEFIKEYAKNDRWSEEVLEIKIESKDWTIVNHKYSGAVLHRSIAFWVYAVWPDGHCTVQGFSAKQKFNGSGFADQLLYNGIEHGQAQVDCK